ncbi:hypothetical protein F2981_17025 [Sinorhizobium meliloti]|nr:hypothetical protein [Sinorhizobium meliloti]
MLDHSRSSRAPAAADPAPGGLPSARLGRRPAILALPSHGRPGIRGQRQRNCRSDGMRGPFELRDDQSVYIGGSGKLKAECFTAAGRDLSSPQAVQLACEAAVEGSRAYPIHCEQGAPQAFGLDESSAAVRATSPEAAATAIATALERHRKNADGHVVTLKPGTTAAGSERSRTLQAGNSHPRRRPGSNSAAKTVVSGRA